MRPNLLYLIERWFWKGVDWIFPPSCAGCGKVGFRLCPTCLTTIDRIIPPYCEICGRDLLSGRECANCEKAPLRITAIRSWAVYNETVRRALHQLKYSRNVALGETFSHFLSGLLVETGWKIDVITPIPLGRARQKERGYNQAALLARPVARKLRICYQPKIVFRKRETLSQVDLSYAERKSNVAGAFGADGVLASGKTVLIIDDITTSGSTINSCAEALLLGGSKRVYGMTVARASGYDYQIQLDT